MKGDRIRADQVLEAAIKRFSYFGIGKTTFTEVAEDLSLTKQALAYYFTDKQSLVKAVMDKLTGEYLQKLRAEMEGAQDVRGALLQLVEVKRFFFKTYYMLVIQADQVEVPDHRVRNWKAQLQEAELELVTGVFRRGIRRGELQAIGPRSTATLFLETLYAFSRCLQEKGSLPDPAAIDEVFGRQTEVIRLFYKGIKTTGHGSNHSE